MSNAHTLRGTTEARRRSKPRLAKPFDINNPKCVAAREKRIRRGIRNRMNHYFEIIGQLDAKANL